MNINQESKNKIVNDIINIDIDDLESKIPQKLLDKFNNRFGFDLSTNDVKKITNKIYHFISEVRNRRIEDNNFILNMRLEQLKVCTQQLEKHGNSLEAFKIIFEQYNNIVDEIVKMKKYGGLL